MSDEMNKRKTPSSDGRRRIKMSDGTWAVYMGETGNDLDRRRRRVPTSKRTADTTPSEQNAHDGAPKGRKISEEERREIERRRRMAHDERLRRVEEKGKEKRRNIADDENGVKKVFGFVIDR